MRQLAAEPSEEWLTRRHEDTKEEVSVVELVRTFELLDFFALSRLRVTLSWSVIRLDPSSPGTSFLIRFLPCNPWFSFSEFLTVFLTVEYAELHGWKGLSPLKFKPQRP